MDTIALKKQLRKELKARRMALSKTEIAEKSQQIFENWRDQFFSSSLKSIHSFISIEKFNELDTNLFIEFIQTQVSGPVLAVPVTDFEQDILTHIAITKEMEWAENEWGIKEPVIRTKKISPSQLDMVLVPMLGFDAHLYRIGYGKGYYDKFLAQTRPDCLKIGLCFDTGFVQDGLPHEPHDVPLDAIITESKVWLRTESNS